ncbi:glycosyltransferase [Weissella confusa]|uniref:Glycosyltransferase n=1 Tax=Weissella confusa TaxID=1583 RepID=A0AAJ2YXG5_WEICO|nr:glycosyltransferase [Weissella confusa]NBA11232.1 glycosyltransferase [Weissella confusa]
MVNIVNFVQNRESVQYVLDSKLPLAKTILLKSRENGQNVELNTHFDDIQNKYVATLNLEPLKEIVQHQSNVQSVWDIMVSSSGGSSAIKIDKKIKKNFGDTFSNPYIFEDNEYCFMQQYVTNGNTIAVSLSRSFGVKASAAPIAKVPVTAVEQANFEVLLNPNVRQSLNTRDGVSVVTHDTFFNHEINRAALRAEYLADPNRIFFVSNKFKDVFENDDFFSMHGNQTRFYEENLSQKNRILIDNISEFTEKNKKVTLSEVDGQNVFTEAYVKDFGKDESNINITIIVKSLDSEIEETILSFTDRDQIDEQGNANSISFSMAGRQSLNEFRFEVPINEFTSYLENDYWLESSVVDVRVGIKIKDSKMPIFKSLKSFDPEMIDMFDEMKENSVPQYGINQQVKDRNPHRQLLLQKDDVTAILINPYAGAGKKFVLQTARINHESVNMLQQYPDVRFPNLAGKGQRIAAYYAKVRECEPVNDNVFLYETRDGQSIVDSPLAMFLELNSRDIDKKLHHKWVVKDLSDLRVRKIINDVQADVEFVERNTKRYYDLLATAKYLITNSTFQNFFSKRDNQIYINTWHGIPLKKMGFDMTKDPRSSQNVLRNFLMTDYFLQPNEYATQIFTKAYKLQNAYEGVILQGAYPRNDLMFSFSKEQVVNLLEFEKTKFDFNKKVLLYSPTWKGDSILKPTDSIDTMHAEMNMLREAVGEEYNVLIKVHPYVYPSVEMDERFAGMLVPDEVDANVVMSITDVLVTDYSSIFFDFAMTLKPIIFYMPDFNSYKKNRGTYMDVKELPGPVAQNISELLEQLKNIDNLENQFTEKKSNFVAKYGTINDGSATAKVVDAIFENKLSADLKKVYLNSTKKKILIYPGSLAGNGITTSYINLMNSIDFNNYDVTQVTTLDKSMGLKNTKKVPDSVRQMFRIGSQMFTLDELVQDACYKAEAFSGENVYFPQVAYEKDFKRLFPSVSFDTVIDFSGYSYSWAALLLGCKNAARIIWQHNDVWTDSQKMIGGVMVHSANVNPLISIYHKFSEIVSVSPALMDINKESLGDYYGDAKATYAVNTINIEAIKKTTLKKRLFVKMPKKDMFGVEIPKFNRWGTNFITMGRLSPEKNQMFLVEAFAKYVKTNSGARLYVLGQGPLAQELREAIAEYGLENNVFMLGHISDPHSIMRHMTAFILPSLYEGQPMVLLEALTLNMKVLATNIPQNEYVLKSGDFGILKSGDDIENFTEGMQEISAAKKSRFEKFDAYEYNRKAIADFLSVIEK